METEKLSLRSATTKPSRNLFTIPEEIVSPPDRPEVRKIRRKRVERPFRVLNLDGDGHEFAPPALEELSVTMESVLTGVSPSSNELAVWHDGDGAECGLRTKMVRKLPYLRIVRDNEVVESFELLPLPDDIADFVSDRLRGARCHEDLVDWFRDTRIRLATD